MKRFLLLASILGLVPVASVRAADAPAPAADLAPITQYQPTFAPPPAEACHAGADCGPACGKPLLGRKAQGCDAGGGCLEKIGRWLCFRPVPVTDLPCYAPNAYRPPLFNWFPCEERCGGGCASGGCASSAYGSAVSYPPETAPAPEAAPGTSPAPAPKVMPSMVKGSKRDNTRVPGFHFAGAEHPPAVTPAAYRP